MSGKQWIAALLLAASAGASLLRLARVREERAVEGLWQELRAGQADLIFDPAMVEGLPAPARRLLLRAISAGTPAARSVRLRMSGSMRLRPGAELLPMNAEQVLSPPTGFVWKAEVGKGLMRFRGFDSYGHGVGTMRWWLYGLVPVVRAHGPDVTRSAAGRMVGEAVLVPSALLPQHGARWEAVDDSTARVELTVGAEAVSLTLWVDRVGRLQRVSIRRWKDDARGRPGYSRFEVDEFAEEQTFDGYTIPTCFRAGWRLGEVDEFPFFYACIDSAMYR